MALVQLWRSSAKFRIGVVITLLLVATSLLSDVLTRWAIGDIDPLATGSFGIFEDPSGDHWLGTDRYGRDVLGLVLDRDRRHRGFHRRVQGRLGGLHPSDVHRHDARHCDVAASVHFVPERRSPLDPDPGAAARGVQLALRGAGDPFTSPELAGAALR